MSYTQKRAKFRKIQ